jgi:hypothetical protein
VYEVLEGLARYIFIGRGRVRLAIRTIVPPPYKNTLSIISGLTRVKFEY